VTVFSRSPEAITCNQQAAPFDLW